MLQHVGVTLFPSLPRASFQDLMVVLLIIGLMGFTVRHSRPAPPSSGEAIHGPGQAAGEGFNATMT